MAMRMTDHPHVLGHDQHFREEASSRRGIEQHVQPGSRRPLQQNNKRRPLQPNERRPLLQSRVAPEEARACHVYSRAIIVHTVSHCMHSHTRVVLLGAPAAET